MDLSKQTIEQQAAENLIGKRVEYFEKIDSTNAYASKIARQGIPEGTVVIADCQTKGRGRMNRVWQSPGKKNLYASIILRPPIIPSVAPQLTLMAGVAVAELLSRYCPQRVMLKWPNDVLVDKKKVCGILTEMRTKGDSIDFAVVGIGININIRKEEFGEEIRTIATSIREETNKEISRIEFTLSLFKIFEKWYKTLLAEGFTTIRKEWMEYSKIIGKDIQVHDKGTVQQGEVLGINSYGALFLVDKEKKIKRILTGDVFLIED